ncbi:zinc finger MYM-type protein 1-like [Macrosteles quadrilineatus]|uniref:zinc finger MYM-type protein 1-like n=1 Tax=Macrosteles quadrilineatus TaxID=74068 RepID=UPI0023E304F4|nr:zinc finger MYM-type protein 1-like [Macrosteles quadrilineatus]
MSVAVLEGVDVELSLAISTDANGKAMTQYQETDEDHITPEQKKILSPTNCRNNQDVVASVDCSIRHTSPHQPQILPGDFPVQKLSGRVLKFQTSWYERFPWLHVAGAEGVSCFYCTRYAQLCPAKALATKADKAFSEKGFSNWKKAIEKFGNHQTSDAHCQAVLSYSQLQAPIESQLSHVKLEQQKLALESLMTIISSVKYLVRQGMAVRGHKNDEGNLMELLKVRCEDKPSLKQWLEKDITYTHPTIQNEIIQILGNEIIYSIVQSIKLSNPLMYSVICDGTRDIAGNEQVSVCVRWADADLEPHESFLGFYESANTCGKDIAALIFDVLLRLELPLSNLRGQTYDGAGNMSGIHKGTQSVVIEKQPLADYIHCGAHCVNLEMKASCETSRTVKNAMDWAHQLGVLFSNTKAKDEYKHIVEDAAQGLVSNIAKIKPLCPTRWIYRKGQINEILQKYPLILKTLNELTERKYEGASGLLSVFEDGTTYLGLIMGRKVVELLELLNKSFQGEKKTVVGLYESVKLIVDGLQNLRTNQQFSSVYEECAKSIAELGLEELRLPRRKKVPKKISEGNANDYGYEFTSTEEHFRREYFEVIETAVHGLKTRILEQAGMKKQIQLEKVLLRRDGYDVSVLAPYPCDG